MTFSHLKESRVLRIANTHLRHDELMKSTPVPGVATLRQQAEALETKGDAIAGPAKQARDAARKELEAWVKANGGTMTADGGRE